MPPLPRAGRSFLKGRPHMPTESPLEAGRMPPTVQFVPLRIKNQSGANRGDIHIRGVEPLWNLASAKQPQSCWSFPAFHLTPATTSEANKSKTFWTHFVHAILYSVSGDRRTLGPSE